MAMTDEEYFQKLKDAVASYTGSYDIPLKKLPFYNMTHNLQKRDAFKNLSPTEILKLAGVPESAFDTGFSEVSLDQLKKEIQEFIDNDGDIDATPVKKTPFYRIIDALRRRPEYEGKIAEDFYEMAGYPIYRRFSVTKLNEILTDIADENGYVDKIKTREKGYLKSVGRMVSGQAKRFGCSSAVYLLGCTDYKFEDVIDNGDYKEYVKSQLLKKYKPGEDLFGISHDNKDEYDQLRRIAIFTASSIKEVAEELGFRYHNSIADYSDVNVEGFRDYFLARFPDGKVPSLAAYPKAYKYAQSCARKLDIPINQLFIENGFEYCGYKAVKFNKMKVDFSEDEQFILKAKKFYYNQSDILNNPSSVRAQIDKEKEQIFAQILKDYNKWKGQRVKKNLPADSSEPGEE